MQGYLVIPVPEWKNALMPGCANMPKAVYTRNLARMFPGVDDPNELDACGIAKSAFSFDAKQMGRWRVWVD